MFAPARAAYAMTRAAVRRNANWSAAHALRAALCSFLTAVTSQIEFRVPVSPPPALFGRAPVLTGASWR